MRNNYILILMFLSITHIGCNEDIEIIKPNDTQIEDVKELVPLKIGNSWTYKITTYDTLGNISWVDTINYYIKGDTVISGNITWFLRGYDHPSFGTYAYRNNFQGLHITNFEELYKIYPYPAEPGDTYGATEVISIDTAVSTPIGELKCYLYETYWRGAFAYDFYAPGVGMVHQDGLGSFNNEKAILMQTHDLVTVRIQ